MAVDTENKRRSVSGYTCTNINPVADASVDANDREMVAWLYSGITAAEPGGVTLMAMERSKFRRIQGRIFGRVN